MFATLNPRPVAQTQSYDPTHPGPLVAHKVIKGRFASLRAELLPTLPSGGALSAIGRRHHPPHRVSMRGAYSVKGNLWGHSDEPAAIVPSRLQSRRLSPRWKRGQICRPRIDHGRGVFYGLSEGLEGEHGREFNDRPQRIPEAVKLNRKGLSRRGILNVIKGFGVGIGAAIILGRDTIAAFAQRIIGVLGSPSATTTIEGAQLPPPPPKFGGVINESAKDSKPWWPPRIVPPKGAPNVLLIMTDDQGYGVSSTFGGIIPTPALDRIANAGLRYTQFHSTALCSPTRAALITGRNHHEVGFGVICGAVDGLSRL